MEFSLENLLQYKFRLHYNSIEEFEKLLCFFDSKKIKYLDIRFSTKENLIATAVFHQDEACFCFKFGTLFFSHNKNIETFPIIETEEFLKTNKFVQYIKKT